MHTLHIVSTLLNQEVPNTNYHTDQLLIEHPCFISAYPLLSAHFLTGVPPCFMHPLITGFTLSFNASKAAKLKGVFFSMYQSIQSVGEVEWGSGATHAGCWSYILHSPLNGSKNCCHFLWPQITLSCMCSFSSSWRSAIPTLDSLWNSRISQTLASIATINALHIN